MRRTIPIICFLLSLISQQTKSQSKAGLFKNLNVKAGFTLTYFHNFQGEYAYILQQNARVVEHADNKDGAALSVVVMFPLDEDDKFNFLLNLPFVDYKMNTAENISFF